VLIYILGKGNYVVVGDGFADGCCFLLKGTMLLFFVE
jgi:hypothetical protein